MPYRDIPLWCALRALGFPVHVLRAWCSFVSGQTRRFKVRQAVGEAVASNCGLPEGCGFICSWHDRCRLVA